MKEKSKHTILHDLFFAPDKICSVLIKKLAENDDSGRHGVLVPVASYPMFPFIENFDPNSGLNYTVDLKTISKEAKVAVEHDSKYKHYQKYPERRLTRICAEVNELPSNSLMIAAKRKDNKYEIHYVSAGTALYTQIIKTFKIDLDSDSKYSYYIDLEWKTLESKPLEGYGIDNFLKKFDKISAKGFIASLRSGDTGIGYTFETEMGIKENNFFGPDYEGIELKCFALGKGASAKKNLFLAEPKWMDEFSNNSDRVLKYGYFDKENERPALYSSVTISENSHKLSLQLCPKEKKVFLAYKKTRVAFWTFDTLAKRLSEKLKETAYIGAVKKNLKNQDHFHYQTVTHCADPFIDSLISIMQNGYMIVELRMHINEKGSVRNHGTGFRIPENQFQELYAKVQKLRYNK